jgi:hypothetical protein
MSVIAVRFLPRLDLPNTVLISSTEFWKKSTHWLQTWQFSLDCKERLMMWPGTWITYACEQSCIWGLPSAHSDIDCLGRKCSIYFHCHRTVLIFHPLIVTLLYIYLFFSSCDCLRKFLEWKTSGFSLHFKCQDRKMKPYAELKKAHSIA